LLTGRNPSVPSINFGNPDLTAEVGETSTAGVVWRPDYLSGFSLALDGYYITINDAVTTVQGFNPSLQRACYDSGGTSPYCALQVRPNGFADTSAANAATAWLITVINISEIETYGADLEANYSREMFGRPVRVRGLASYQPHIFYKQPALPTIDQGGVAFGTNGLVASPVWRLTAIVSAKVTEAFTVDVLGRWRNGLKLGGDPTQVWVKNHVASFGTANLNLTYTTEQKSGQAEFFLNVQNLFDKDPPPAAFSGAGTIPGLFGGWSVGDDPIGRYYMLGARFKL
jgi:outer membrane receptor protein involved in Fe transport